ncbi:hypothetical protein BH11CYA1_BH11CYA1_03930 [soil metagenome]
MLGRGFGLFMYATILLMVIVAFLFGILSWMKVPVGTTVDWIIGVASAWWLLIITTVPWNVYFESMSVLDEANNSKKAGIDFDASKIKFVKKLKTFSIVLAIGLHAVSSLALFYLSAAHITPVGYYGAAAAALLTVLRPALRAYEYLWQKLREIKQSIVYPREDVIQLRVRIESLESKLRNIDLLLDPHNASSLPARTNRELTSLKATFEDLARNYTKLLQDNRAEHETLRREGQNAISKLSSDSQFLDHVREIVRMIKSA